MAEGLASLVEELAVQLPGMELPGQPYLEQLHQAVYGGIGRNAAGAANQWRVPLNSAAVKLRDRVRDEIADQFEAALILPPTSSPAVNLLFWWGAFSAAIERGETNDVQVAAAIERLTEWRQAVKNLVDPPRVKEFDAPCPTCGARHVIIGEGELAERRAALVAEYKPGMMLVALCRNEQCGARWDSDAGVIALGKLTGMPLDADKIRDALTPRPDTWSPDEVAEEALDLSNPVHRALYEARNPTDRRD